MMPEYINLNELTEKHLKLEENKKKSYNRELNKIHIKIKHISRLRNAPMYCLYGIPRFVMGEDYYVFEECIKYIVSKLSENGLIVKYIHPDTIFVSWSHIVLPAPEEKIQNTQNTQYNIVTPLTQNTTQILPDYNQPNNSVNSLNNNSLNNNLVKNNPVNNNLINNNLIKTSTGYISTSSVFYNDLPAPKK